MKSFCRATFAVALFFACITLNALDRQPNADYQARRVALANYMNAHGKDLHGEPIGKYFIHGIGHSVGIDVHDPYDYSQPIQKGMVFTIEPGIYIPEEKIGVRIEDVFYASPDRKLECLTCTLPKDADAVEKAMRK